MLGHLVTNVRSRGSTRLRVMVVAVAGLLVLTSSVVLAISPPSPGPFTGCLSANGVKGLIYNVAASSTTPVRPCLRGDTIIAFSNANGPKGDQGIQGIQGPPGHDGAPGSAGTNGQDGAPGAAGAPGHDGASGQGVTAVTVAPAPDGTCGSAGGFDLKQNPSGTSIGALCNGAAGAPGAPGAPGAGPTDLAALNGLHCTKTDLDLAVRPGIVVVANAPNGNGSSVGSGNPVALTCEYSALLTVSFPTSIGDMFVYEGVSGSSGHQWALCPAAGANTHVNSCQLRLPAGPYSLMPASNAVPTWSGGCTGAVNCVVTLPDYSTVSVTALAP